ncbi:MAG: cbb3-type cytochrome c oxidase subunit 3 [Pseudomonadota bacterium]|jgi:cytochrome c oxidase cbb3-type subunit 4|nr:MAG: CcoQ/FixQ family Cbb3-type cytochrome c oxidase assembly chaperone [Pseudomonadota bacterium]HEX5600586.1 cbb3-type cytochrome c oxidase subunit 3 [Hyphomicrobiaceae bacterium]
MTYDTVAQFSQITSLFLFIALFIGVIAYAFWPGNRRRFEAAQRQALDLDDDTALRRGRK